MFRILLFNCFLTLNISAGDISKKVDDLVKLFQILNIKLKQSYIKVSDRRSVILNTANHDCILESKWKLLDKTRMQKLLAMNEYAQANWLRKSGKERWEIGGSDLMKFKNAQKMLEVFKKNRNG